MLACLDWGRTRQPEQVLALVFAAAPDSNWRIAIERVRRIHEHAGVLGLFVDAIDAHAAQFYARYGFEAFMDEPLKLFLPVKQNR